MTIAPAALHLGAGITWKQANPATFASVLNAVRASGPLYDENLDGFVDVDETDYRLSARGTSGFAIRPGGELVYVFSIEPGRGDHLVDSAVLLGATHLNCFEGHLTRLYARHGFVEVGREANWTPGGPDVVYMERKSA